MEPTLSQYLLVSGALFAIGLLGVIVRRNLLIIYMSLELMLNAANVALVAMSRFNEKAESALDGQVMVFFIITVAAAEVAVGALFSVYKSSIESKYGEASQQQEVAADTGQAEVKVVGSTRALGQALFSGDKGFILPFEIVSILLLVAMVGVILLSRKEPR